MKKESQNDLRYIKTENLIRTTFRDMLKEMDFAQITIKKLTDRAMINRKTFYLHYSSLDDLLIRLQKDIYAQVLASTSKIKLPEDLDKLIRELFLFWTESDEISEKILCSRENFPVGKSSADNVIKSMLHYSLPNDSLSCSNGLESNIIDAYLSGSIMYIYAQWIADGRKIPLERLIQLTAQLISQGMNTFPISE